MDEDFFAPIDQAIKKANGSTDPGEVADKNQAFIASDLTGSIIGMAMRVAYLGVISVNHSLDRVMRYFTEWHELGHILRGHVDEPGFNYHQDKGIFTHPYDARQISQREREANLVSAEVCLDTNLILELTGYHSRMMNDYRQLKKDEKKIQHDYENLRFSANAEFPSNTIKLRLLAYQKALQELEKRRCELESDIAAQHCCTSLSEIAGELGTNEIILKYKLEAMRIRGYDIEVAELERYDKVFRNAI